MSSLVDSIFYFQTISRIKAKAAAKLRPRTQARTSCFPEPSLRTGALRCQTACARPAPPNHKTQVTWGAWLSARLRAAGRRRLSYPGRTGVRSRWEPRLRLRRQPGLGLGPGPPGMALRPSKGDGSAGRWDRGAGKAGTEDGGLGRRGRAAQRPGPEGGGGG